MTHVEKNLASVKKMTSENSVTASYDEALEMFGLDFEVESKGIAVAGGKKIPFKNAIVRKDTGAALGIVSPSYPAISPREKFSGLREFADNGVIEFVKGGMFGSNGGRAYIVARLPQCINVNPEKGDMIEKRLLFYTSYDGTASNDFGLLTYRLACLNGMIASEREISAYFKNSKKSGIHFANMAQKIRAGLDYYDTVSDFYAKAMQTTVTARQVEDFAEKVISAKIDPETGKFPTKTENRKISLIETIENGQGQEIISGMNVFKLLQGVTCWTNHVLLNDKKDETDFLYFGTGAKINEKAYNLCHELITV